MSPQKKQAQRKAIMNLAIVFSIAAAALALWTYFNRPIDVANWPEHISGYSFSPYRYDQSPIEKRFPTPEQIREDLTLVATQTSQVRTYSVENTLGDIPQLADKHGLTVTLGVYISGEPELDYAEMNRAIEIANQSHNIDRIIVGNETLLKLTVRQEQLITYIDYVRGAVKVPVTTAEPWHIWYLKSKEPTADNDYIHNDLLVEHCDVIAAHVLPYWDSFNTDDSIRYVLKQANTLRQAFPNKPLLLAEVGWPSEGRMRGEAQATRAEQAIYLRTLVNLLNQNGYQYFVIEAFDQLWKQQDEGSVGAYWGVYDVDRQPKFPFEGPIQRIPQWRMLGFVSAMLAVLSLTLLLIDSSGLRQVGRVFLATVAFTCASLLVLIAYDYSQQYITWVTIVMGFFLSLGTLGIIAVMYTEAHELAEVVWAHQRRRPFGPVTADDAYRPKVSVHVPCYNEPPDMVKQTLDALAKLDYPNFEVLVIDNNTKNPAVWQPVAEYCAQLGERFRFFHVAPLAGFKAGALNYALERTVADAEIVAVIDADYIVEPDWLKHLVPHFVDPNIAIVQSPQDYRDEHESLFKELCYAEYEGFFHIGMVTRNDRDAIIQHGTMTMTRRSVLDEVRWAEWCITEDAELGLRIFQRGLSAAYVKDSYGKGVMPDTFIDFKKQRFRWAYGAIQITKRHARSLLTGKGTKLTAGQRYHFLAGWMPWVADGINIFYTLGALFWAGAMIIAPARVDPPSMVFAIPPMALFLFKIAKIFIVYRKAVDVSLMHAIKAAIAGLAMSHTIAKAVVYGFVTSDIPFFRTPKMAAEHGLLRAFSETREELFFLLLLWGTSITVILVQPIKDGHFDLSRDVILWSILLGVQALPYFAAVVMACFSAMPPRKKNK